MISPCRTRAAAKLLALLIGVIAFGSVTRADALELTVRQGPTSADGTITAIVEGRNLAGLGALELELIYDPDLLEVTGVSKEAVLANGMLEHDLRPNRVRCVMITGEAVAKDGDLLSVEFVKRQESGRASIDLAEVLAWGFERREELLVRTSAGELDCAAEPASGAVGPTVWVLGLSLAGVALLALLVLVYRQGRRRGATG